jgi:hypothetical protein
MDELGRGAPDYLLARIPEYALERRIDIAHPALEVDDAADVARELEPAPPEELETLVDGRRRRARPVPLATWLMLSHEKAVARPAPIPGRCRTSGAVADKTA